MSAFGETQLRSLRMYQDFHYYTNTRLVSILQIGNLHQIDYKVNDKTGRDFLQLGYFIELFGKKSAKLAIENELKDN